MKHKSCCAFAGLATLVRNHKITKKTCAREKHAFPWLFVKSKKF